MYISSDLFLFSLFVFLLYFCCFMVFTAESPVHSVLYLVLLFFNGAAVLFLTGVEFLSFVYIVVYVGAIAVLFLFVVMMLDVRSSENNPFWYVSAGFGLFLGFYFIFEFFFLFSLLSFKPAFLGGGSWFLDGNFVWFKDWSLFLTSFSNIESLGFLVYITYVHLFLIGSIVLLLAMVGVIVLTRNSLKGIKRQEISYQVNRDFNRTLVLKSTMIFFFGFQESATPYMEGIINFHNDVLFYLILILIFVLNVFVAVIFNFGIRVEFPQQAKDVNFRNIIMFGNKITHGQTLEIIWTLIPCVILYLIATPSLALLYSLDEVVAPTLTFKVIGHQWYWSYEFSDLGKDMKFDSYMITTDDLKLGQFRNLDVDNQVILPVNTHIRAIITSGDVLHSWSVNSLGIKVDAVPGRLNQASIFIKREGVFYGQCSEICGVQHGFMPIVVKAVSVENFISYYKSH